MPERAEYIRVITAELERIHSHILWAGVAAHEIGFDTVLYLTWRVREKVMDLLEYLTGNRVNYAMYMIGGVRRDITEEQIPKVREALDYYKSLFDKLCKIFLEDKTIKMDVNGKEVSLFIESTCQSMSIRLERGLDGRERMGWQSLYYGQRTPAPTTCASVNETLPVRFVTLVCLGRGCAITECSADSVIVWSEDGENVSRVELAPPGSDDEVIKAVRFGSDNDWQLSSRSK